jgi:hypothetical protein
LLHVKLSLAQSATRAAMRGLGTQVTFVGGVTAPFAEAAPETADETFRSFGSFAHQSSPMASPTTAPWLTPEKSLSQRVAI